MSTGGPMGGGVITGRDGLGNPIVTYYASGPTAPAGGWFNVWDYWQDTDAWPVLDHTPMIRRALDACRLSGQGGTVYCPAYTYQLASTHPCPTAPAAIYAAALHIGSNTRLLGDGEGKTIFVLGPSAPDQSAILMNYDPTAGGDTNIAIEHLTLDGNAAAQSAPSLDAINGLVCWKVRGLAVRHVTVKDCYGTTGGGNGPFGTGGESAAINPQACMDVTLESCTAYATTAQTATGFGVNYCSSVRITDCVAHNMGLGQGIAVYYCSAVNVKGCHAYLNGGCGCDTEHSVDVCWDACTAGGLSAPLQSYPLANSTPLGNALDGFLMVGSDNTNVRFVNCHAGYNGNSGQHSGFYFVGTGIRASNCSAIGNQAFGFQDQTGGAGALVIRNPYTNGNGVHGFWSSLLSFSWDQSQATPYFPTFPASGTIYTNNFPFPVTVLWVPSTATVSQIKINTQGLSGAFLTAAGTFRLMPGDTMTFTYTGGPPQWEWWFDVG